MLWGGWFVLHYLTFALAEGTFHPYYMTAMAPGIAALAGAGGVMLYGAFRERRRREVVLGASRRDRGSTGVGGRPAPAGLRLGNAVHRRRGRGRRWRAPRR